MWIVIYIVEKVYLERYLERVYVEDSSPPNLWPFILTCIAVESIAFFSVLAVFVMLMYKYGSSGLPFVIDGTLIQGIVMDYVATTWIVAMAAMLIANTMQNCQLLRYSHDGLRGIRAFATIVFYIFIIVLTIPLYQLA